MTKLLFLLSATLCVQKISSFRNHGNRWSLSSTATSLKCSAEDNLINQLKEALLARPDQEPLLFNLGLLLNQKIDALQLGNESERSTLITEALGVFGRAVKIDDNRDASWYIIANLKQQAGDNHGAMIAYRRAIKITESPDVLSACYSNLIQMLLRRGDLEEAAIMSNEAVNALPEDSTAWTNMGIVLRDNLSYDWAIICFENAVKFSEGANAVALNNLGNIYFQSGDMDKAYAAYSQALIADPDDEASAYSLAMIIRDSGDREAAKTMFARCIDINPSNSAAKFQLAALLGNSDLEQCPPEYVAELFDHYAKKGYESHMVNSLKYKVPDYIWDAFVTSESSAPYSESLVIVDLGAGTGLIGSRFRTGLLEKNNTSVPYQVQELTACDLSQEMIVRAYELSYNVSAPSALSAEQSEQRENVYTDVVISDCTSYLQDRVTLGAASADLILAGDVLVYMGNLEALFLSVRGSLSCTSGTPGRFIFSVEKMQETDNLNLGYTLQASARFAHSQEYIERIAQKCGLAVTSCIEVPIRHDGGKVISGFIFVLQ